MKITHLEKYPNHIGGLHELRKFLFQSMEDDLFVASVLELIYNVLLRISPQNKNIKKNDQKSLEQGCKEIIDYFFALQREAVMVNLTTGKKSKTFKEKRKGKTTLELFMEDVLEFKHLPIKSRDHLMTLVMDDLKNINRLIEEYSQTPIVRRFLKERRLPNSHEDGTIFEFYNRCIIEREIILKHYLHGISERAIAKSRNYPKWLTASIGIADQFNDRPYNFGHPFMEPYFDHDLLDLVSHRLEGIEANQAEELKALHDINKQEFYERLEEAYPIKQVFSEYKYYLSQVPLMKDSNRKVIFDEIERLYQAEHWIGLYSLALSQVEGLFTEMLGATSSKRSGSLPDKVKSVRTFHYMDKYYFDYYQFHVPKLRNKFMHAGYEDDYELKSLDLLYDLAHLLKLFYELDHAHIKISKIINGVNETSFETIDEFAMFFSLIKSLSKTQKEQVSEELAKFEKEYLTIQTSIDYLCFELKHELPSLLERLDSKIRKYFEFTTKAQSLLDLLLKNQSAQAVEDILTFANVNDLYFEKLANLRTFLSTFHLHLPSLRNTSKTTLNELNKTYRKQLWIAQEINSRRIA